MRTLAATAVTIVLGLAVAWVWLVADAIRSYDGEG